MIFYTRNLKMRPLHNFSSLTKINKKSNRKRKLNVISCKWMKSKVVNYYVSAIWRSNLWNSFMMNNTMHNKEMRWEWNNSTWRLLREINKHQGSTEAKCNCQHEDQGRPKPSNNEIFIVPICTCVHTQYETISSGQCWISIRKLPTISWKLGH